MDDSERPTCCKRTGRFFSLYWRVLVLLATPSLAALLFLVDTGPAYRCMFVVLIMAVYWITEALPLPITSMIPVVLFPLLGILDTDRTCMMYMRETLLMFMGGIFLALAIEHCNLHKRIALKVICSIGCSQRKLNFGLLAVTMFVSMWISNTATVAMMCPIMKAVLEELEAQGLCQMYLKPKQNEMEKQSNETPIPSRITICYYTGAAYAASIGGLGTLLGTGTNLTYKGIYENRFPEGNPIDFFRFTIYNTPGMLLGTFLVWIYLQVVYMGMFRPNSKAAQEATISKEGETIAHGVIMNRYGELGPITSHEISVAILFVISIALFFTRKPGFTTGWADLLPETKIQDATPAILTLLLLFIFPANWQWLNFLKINPTSLPTERTPSLITWKYINDKTPWSLIFLLGGGFALAEGGKASGMSEMIGQSLSVLKNLPLLLLLFIVCLVVQILTEFASNVAICNIILPVMAEMSLAIELHPMYLMLPVAISCSYAFMMPVGTPPLAIVAGLGHIQTKDLIKAGVGVKVIMLLIIWGLFPVLGPLVYPEIKDFPDWARPIQNSSETPEQNSSSIMTY
ncbi:protein I'm not dead yet-like [Aedes albopictus]|uniref:Na+/dicarboxylate na+/tricarboxylate and phosphate transporter n=1 Tax=Aedes albopictus TaxID=7160 RepID=A0ABM1YZK1_AEDAL